MSLSVCLIARNEESNIARALESVRSVADEIIVTDTGSTDRTIEIAESLGAKVSHFPWCDDFSAARNHAVEQATCDWVFWLDADEELLPPGRSEWRELFRRKDAMGYHIIRRDLMGTAEQTDFFTEMWQLRIFRRRPDLRFLGRCHPHFEPPIEDIAAREGKQVLFAPVVIRHYGYIGEMKESKLRRGARLLALELQDRPDQPYYMIELGRTLLQVGDPKGHEVLGDATRIILRHRGDKTPPTPIVALLFEYLLTTDERDLKVKTPRDEILVLAHRWFPLGAPLVWLEAQLRFGEEDFESAAALLEKLVRMGRMGEYDRSVSFDPRIIGDDALLNLGVCYLRMAELDRAESCFKRLMKSSRASEAAANLEAIRSIRAMQ
jgi:hypothetical protein